MYIFSKTQSSLFLSLFCFSSLVFPLDFFGSDDEKNYIWKSGLNRYLKYEELDDQSFGNNDHPVNINEDELKLALRALEVPDDSFFALEEETKNIFTPLQIKLLVEKLPKGLRNAKPDQDIIFALEKDERKLLGLQDKRFMSGRIFYKDNKLNIIVGEYDFFRSKAFESAYDPSGQAAVPYTFNFGKRTKASKAFKGIFINVPGVENKQLNKIRHDWFVIDVKYAAQEYANRDKRNQEDSFQNKQLEAEAAKLARERRLMRAEMARMRKEMQDGNGGGASAKSIEERIATLDELLKKELITQDEYDNKRTEILNDI